MNTDSPQASTAAPVQHRRSIRRPALLVVGVVVLLLAAASGTYWYTVSRFQEDTDDAYVNGRVVTITPQVSGTVVAVGADETDTVKAGDMLVRLDPDDARIELEQREAQLAQTVREVRTLFANNDVLQASVTLRETELARARDDLSRRQSVAHTGVVSTEEIRHAESAVASADAALNSARQQLSANQVQTSGTTIARHPRVSSAAAQVREAWLTLQRGQIVAPIAGQVARRNVQVGQRLTPGTPIMALVPMGNLWVDANFKEVQLEHMRIGQAVRVTVDMYGGHVTYHGHIIGLGAGTGAAFSLLPAQNATGNWIKVVQRVPVKIALDPRDMAEHPLRVGLSVRAVVDLHDQNGARVSLHSEQSPDNQTTVYDQLSRDADDRVKRIIDSNLGDSASRHSGQSHHG